MRTNIDLLALGNFLLNKADQPAWHEQGNWRTGIALDRSTTTRDVRTDHEIPVVLVYFLVILPIGILSRVFRDPLHLELRPELSTYWISDKRRA
ncbi:hypothetical protein [Salinispora oceanensis]|uniref:hypothetical protein n=1 Tax=Salinispora oceanensis TaxID=1050199 RepID=UPI0003674E21|nr:hypothetical protein [Salinispora oceanensis]